MNLLKLQPVNPQVCGVHTSAGVHVGNLKLISGASSRDTVGWLTRSASCNSAAVATPPR